jgi:hypothetical protein
VLSCSLVNVVAGGDCPGEGEEGACVGPVACIGTEVWIGPEACWLFVDAGGAKFWGAAWGAFWIGTCDVAGRAKASRLSIWTSESMLAWLERSLDTGVSKRLSTTG